VALALLYELYGDAVWSLDLPPVRHFADAERHLLTRMLGRRVNTPVTTSMGRLFDGVASIAGLQQTVTFEGQAAILLEHVADAWERGGYPLPLVQHSDTSSLSLDWEPLVRAALDDAQHGAPASQIAARFHNGLVRAMVQVAQAVGQPRVALTGGCFQNRMLTERAHAALTSAGFEVLLHRQTPPNDGCVSLGQVAVAAARAPFIAAEFNADDADGCGFT
jgi:hydrogenase maturation protein HypF